MSLEEPLHLTFRLHLETVVSANRKQFDICQKQCLGHVFTQPGRSSLQPQDTKREQNRKIVHHGLALILQSRDIPTNISPNDFETRNDYRKWAFKYNDLIVESTIQGTGRGGGEDMGQNTHQPIETTTILTEESDENSSRTQLYPDKDEEYDSTGRMEGWTEIENEVTVLCPGTEIITRDLPCDSFGFDELTRGIDLIKANVRLSVNETCGVKVHVGNGGQAFSVNTIKRFSQLVTAFEYNIESIMPMDFLLGRNCRTHAMSPSEGRHLNSWNVFSNLQRIERCTDLESIVGLMNPGHNENFAYNFLNLLLNQSNSAYDEDPGRTIELRQFRGTMDVLAITSYTHFITSLLTFAHKVSPQLILLLCMEHVADPNFTIVNLLETTDGELLIPHYKSVLTVRERPSTLTFVRETKIEETFLLFPYGYHPTPESWGSKSKAKGAFLCQTEEDGKNEVVSQEDTRSEKA